jgi:hypothetical protein
MVTNAVSATKVAPVTFAGRLPGALVVDDVNAGFGAGTPDTHCGQSCANVRVMVIGVTVVWNVVPLGVSETPLGKNELTEMVAPFAGKSHVISQFGTDVGTSHATASTTVVSKTQATRCRIVGCPSTSSRRAAVRSCRRNAEEGLLYMCMERTVKRIVEGCEAGDVCMPKEAP